MRTSMEQALRDKSKLPEKLSWPEPKKPTNRPVLKMMMTLSRKRRTWSPRPSFPRGVVRLTDWQLMCFSAANQTKEWQLAPWVLSTLRCRAWHASERCTNGHQERDANHFWVFCTPRCDFGCTLGGLFEMEPWNRWWWRCEAFWGLSQPSCAQSHLRCRALEHFSQGPFLLAQLRPTQQKTRNWLLRHPRNRGMCPSCHQRQLDSLACAVPNCRQAPQLQAEEHPCLAFWRGHQGPQWHQSVALQGTKWHWRALGVAGRMAKQDEIEVWRDLPALAGVAAAGDNERKESKKWIRHAVHWSCAHLLTPFCPLFFHRSSFRKWKKSAPTRPSIGPLSSRIPTRMVAAGRKTLPDWLFQVQLSTTGN